MKLKTIDHTFQGVREVLDEDTGDVYQVVDNDLSYHISKIETDAHGKTFAHKIAGVSKKKARSYEAAVAYYLVGLEMSEGVQEV